MGSIISGRGVAYEETGKNTGKSYSSLEKIETMEDICILPCGDCSFYNDLLVDPACDHR